MSNFHKSALSTLLANPHQLAHALLIRGSRGVGKLAFAQGLAQSLLCEKPNPDGHACGACRSCQWITSGNHPDIRILAPQTAQSVDVLEVEGAAAGEGQSAGAKGKEVKASPWITIDQVRELGDFISMSSHRGGRKIIVVCPAEAMNPAAANAILKNLEEPPANTHFILVSHRPQRLLRTIVSRCRQLYLPKPSGPAALAWLAEQGVNHAEIVLAQASGAPLLALELSENEVLSGRSDFLRALAVSDFEPLAVAERFRDLSLESFIGWLQRWTGDLIEQRMLGRLRFNPDFSSEIAMLARRIQPLDALRFHRKLILEQRNIHHPLNARLYMESVMLAYAALLNPARRAA